MAGKIAIVGYPGYMTDGVDIYSFKRGPIKPQKKTWFKLRGVDVINISDGNGGYRSVSRLVLKQAYENHGVLPERGALRTLNPKRKQYKYMLNGKQISVKDISKITGLSEPNIRVKMLKNHILNYGIYTFTKVLKK